jgi:predicted metal-binding protein
MAKKEELIVCHNCLTNVTFKKVQKLERNNFGIPHIVLVCKKCYDAASTRKR